MPSKRTTHRSARGTKLYAVRDKKGLFKDIQTYKKAHGQDIKRKSKGSDEHRFSSVTIVRPSVRPDKDSEATLRKAVREVFKQYK
jgi:hypothetical protein